MTKTRVTIVMVFVVAFAAGLAMALVVRQAEKPPGRGPSWLAGELNLSPSQQDEMPKIWGGLGRSNWQEESDRRKSIQKQRDEAIRQLVPSEKQAELDRIMENHTRQMAEMAEQRNQVFAAAVEKTKTILTPEQRKKYEEILARRSEGRRNGGPGGGREWPRPGSEDSATSKPSPSTNPPAMP